MNSDELFAPIAALDLDPIKVKLMHKESGEGWSRQYADAVEFEYRRFLYLIKKFPNEQTAPLFDVDIFWHYHILDTMKYAADCDEVFGYFLHHFPYVGLRGEDDEALHHQIGARMQELYEETFGEAYFRQHETDAAMPAAEAAITNAWYIPEAAKTAFSQPATPKMAFSQPATPKMAFFQPTTLKIAFSQPATGRTSFSQAAPAMMELPQHASLNDSYYSRPVLPSTI